MKNLTISSFTTLLVLSLLSGFAVAAPAAPMTPEVAAKRENYRKQQEQRITPEKRKAAAEALKAERIRVYNATKGAQPVTPVPPETK